MEEEQKHIFNKQAVRNLLESGERISVKFVWRVLLTTELRTYLSQLRKDGLDIGSEWMRNKNNQRYKEYFLVNQTAGV